MKKKDIKAVQIYVETLFHLIVDARAKVIEAGGHPNVMYIGDIFSRKKDELRPSAMQLDTGCTVLGMKIIADFRVPFDHFYIMQGKF